ncbi:hypothetical protein [Mesorhizobium sp.]|uniref:hypothetical protein n=1 Tax=Mesorhizobium sp. TaxID=1871066 RepID=UPI000FE934EB|nr:hypothetical protein [Mesorhizobium sp.]RWD35580.1 MAG: hypothetical protein EOS33_07265 [Mesorhizobium sp.]
MTDGEKEKIKMRATFANGIGLAIVAAGGLAPMIAIMTKQFDQSSILKGFVLFAGALITGTAFHSRAIAILGSLDSEKETKAELNQSIAVLVGLLALGSVVLYALIR